MLEIADRQGRLGWPTWSRSGYDRETVKKIERLIYLSEYKRFQSAPGTRLTERAFWLDRRYPIVNRWRDETGN